MPCARHNDAIANTTIVAALNPSRAYACAAS